VHVARVPQDPSRCNDRRRAGCSRVRRYDRERKCIPHDPPAVGASNDTELEKLKKRLQFVVNCIDCFIFLKNVAFFECVFRMILARSSYKSRANSRSAGSARDRHVYTLCACSGVSAFVMYIHIVRVPV
jgi:hypothetical protein